MKSMIDVSKLTPKQRKEVGVLVMKFKVVNTLVPFNTFVIETNLRIKALQDQIAKTFRDITDRKD